MHTEKINDKENMKKNQYGKIYILVLFIIPDSYLKFELLHNKK